MVFYFRYVYYTNAICYCIKGLICQTFEYAIFPRIFRFLREQGNFFPDKLSHRKSQLLYRLEFLSDQKVKANDRRIIYEYSKIQIGIMIEKKGKYIRQSQNTKTIQTIL